LDTHASPTPLWDHFVGLHQAELERKVDAKCVIVRENLDPELTPFGFVRWYMHPLLDEPVSHAMYFLELEVPAGSRSGRLRHQGSIVNLFVEGEGYTVVDGVRYDWVTEDVVAIPAKPDGVEFQHFAADGGPVRIVIAWPNHDSSFGTGLGVDLAVLEPAPEYVAGAQLLAAR
jgi:hypothetical protein